MKRVLVTGCLGQIGSELVTRLRQDLGKENVIATDIRLPEQSTDDELFEILDVMDYEKMRSLVETYQVDTLIHLAALLSAVAEAKPKFAWDLNMVGLVNALEVAREFDLKFFTPSSIGAFGPDTPKKKYTTRYTPTPYYDVWSNKSRR
ncbi:NAD-dependent epimerase/dehydratase, L-threonine dehydrogenase [Enterococcus durans]|uniref:NAD-dependent epimerase/dehydratase, L-threonine dehydrogenase n=1 Tax=Enterococcus durans TaxID=53345 RepID=A0A377KLR8_9ENTE|nr:NAD-dependent epimerase/dehydratase, L-threonine dehydrogenase [Enterococcus durans]